MYLIPKEFFNLDGSFCKENIDRFLLDKGLPIKLTALNETPIYLDEYYNETFIKQKEKYCGIKTISDATNKFRLDSDLSKHNFRLDSGLSKNNFGF